MSLAHMTNLEMRRGELELARTLPMRLVVNNQEVYERLAQGVDAVGFDLESTLGLTESSDYIMRRRAKAVVFEDCAKSKELKELSEEIEHLTALGMNGKMSVEESMRKRWGMIKPTKEEFAAVAKEQLRFHTPHAKETVRALQGMGKEAFMVTGGFSVYAHELAGQFGIPLDNIVCNTMVFDENGNYEDIEGPALEGKSSVCEDLVRERNITPERFVLVGDGGNDLEVFKKGVAPVIGFGGVRTSDVLDTQFPVYLKPAHGNRIEKNSHGSLASVLSVICTPEEQAALPVQLLQHVALAA